MTPNPDPLLIMLDEPPAALPAAADGSVRVVVSGEAAPTVLVRLPPDTPDDQRRAAIDRARRLPAAPDGCDAAALEAAHRSVLAMDSKARHDIANQLMVLSGYLELLEDMLPDGEGREFLEGALRAAGLVNRHVNFTRAYREFGTAAPAWQALEALLPAGVELPSEAAGVLVWADSLAPLALEGLLETRAGPGVCVRASLASDEGGGLTLLLDDDGPPLDARDLLLLFEYRQGDDGPPAAFLARHLLGATGIGLEAEPSPAGGLRFRVAVPPGCSLSGSGR